MKMHEMAVVPLFEKFVKDSKKGRRVKADGSRIKLQTARNYEYVLRYLKEYELKQGVPIRLRNRPGHNQRAMQAEKKYWTKFYLGFTQFLYEEKQCYDAYVGTVGKVLKSFFNYINKEYGVQTGDFHKRFYVQKEEIPILSLQPEQLRFLINDKAFAAGLGRPLQKCRAIFVFGCTVALRVADLFALKFTDLEYMGGQAYLQVRTQKTGQAVRIMLPDYALDIVEAFRQTARRRKTIFPPVPRTRFNKQIKMLAAQAGWTEPMAKKRSRKGVQEVVQTGGQGATRFCDFLSSHTMRRTAITTMLMLGMREHVVKQISGHAANSASFHRYVGYVQRLVDDEMAKVFGGLREAGGAVLWMQGKKS